MPAVRDKRLSGSATSAEARRRVQALLRYVATGYTVLTWHGLGIDFDILADESATRDECKELDL
ncbi:MAG: hypothetical protein L0Z07_09820, partial [Planctomycetes bacterium]|nr:hypothetical protein [Planctomycetota bacterium]